MDGKASGPGKMVWRVKKDGEWKTSSYEGDFKDGNFHGRGVLVFPDGDRYEGDFKDGNYHGRGVFVAANGKRYAGEWRDNFPQGSGTFYSGGDVYSGTWSNGCFQQGNRQAWVQATKSSCGF